MTTYDAARSTARLRARVSPFTVTAELTDHARGLALRWHRDGFWRVSRTRGIDVIMTFDAWSYEEARDTYRRWEAAN